MSKIFNLWLSNGILLCLAIFLLDSCSNDPDAYRIPDCKEHVVFSIGDLDTTEIISGGEISFRNKSNPDSLQLIIAKGDINEAIKHSEMPRFYFDFGDGSPIDSANTSNDVTHQYKYDGPEEETTYVARLVFFDLPCETRPIEIKVKKIKSIPQIVDAKIRASINRVYEGQSIELEEFGNGTHAWEWYEGVSLIGRGKKITFKPLTKGTKHISCKVNNGEGKQVTVNPNSITITVIKKNIPIRRPSGPSGGKEIQVVQNITPPLCDNFELDVLSKLAKELQKTLNFKVEERAKFTTDVNSILEKYKKQYPLCEDKLLSSKIGIDDAISSSDEKISTLANLRTQISQGADVAKRFKGCSVEVIGGKLKLKN